MKRKRRATSSDRNPLQSQHIYTVVSSIVCTLQRGAWGTLHFARSEGERFLKGIRCRTACDDATMWPDLFQVCPQLPAKISKRPELAGCALLQFLPGLLDLQA